LHILEDAEEFIDNYDVIAIDEGQFFTDVNVALRFFNISLLPKLTAGQTEESM
jgi:hypothetical protein